MQSREVLVGTQPEPVHYGQYTMARCGQSVNAWHTNISSWQCGLRTKLCLAEKEWLQWIPKRERESEREREREIEREQESEREREKGRERESKRARERERKGDREREGERERERGRYRERESERERERAKCEECQCVFRA